MTWNLPKWKFIGTKQNSLNSARMPMVRFSLFCVLLVFPLQVWCQTDSVVPANFSVVPDRAYFISYLTDARDVIVSPLRWNTAQWIGFTAITGGFVLLLSQDAKIQQLAQANRSPFMDGFVKYGIEPWGSGWYSLPALGILYGAGAIAGDNKARATALKGVEAFFFGAVSSQVIKQLAHRHRPMQDSPPDPSQWEGPFAPLYYTSFPSGHATVVFAVAAVVATAYKETIWVPVICYSLASLTALSRIYDNRHWASDVLIGSALGFAIGKSIINNHLKNIRLLPVSHTGLGAMVVYKL